ncbi:MAG TPA: hydroxymethylbilane synthase [Bacteroidia bacterium]|nr:hydroxymethylbilane synthase [Bacteroidia bacterium]
MRTPLIIGTRGSDLALWQANFVKKLLEGIGLASEIHIIKTQGDLIQHLSFDKLEGKGFFTKEIEEGLLSGQTDIAVHSHKDLPTESPESLKIAFVSDREDPSELLLIRKEAVESSKKFALKKGAIVGTSSARRKSQLLAFRPDIQLKELRGNVPTRINKLREKNYDAILIASAGVERLEINLSEFHVEKLDPREFIPAPAQGVLAIQIRAADQDLFQALQRLNHVEIANTIGIERKVLNLFQGGCQMPVGVYAEYDEDVELYKVRASKAERWDTLPVSVYLESSSPEGMAERIVEKIRSIKPCKVFITRDLREKGVMQNVLQGLGFNLEGKAMIETLPVSFHSLPDSEWIFFSSKQAVKFFFRQQPDLREQKFACVGKATAEELRKFGKRADFIGSSNDTKMTGKQFAARVGSGKVLFPQAKGSLRSIQQQFVKPEQVIDLVVYETKKKNDGPAPEAEMIVFTSPSNVEAWFERFRIHPEQKIIAMGDATANALRQFGTVRLTKPDAFDDAAILRAIFGMSGREHQN